MSAVRKAEDEEKRAGGAGRKNARSSIFRLRWSTVDGSEGGSGSWS